MEPELREVVDQITVAVNAHVTTAVTAAEQRLGDQAQRHRDELTAVIAGEVTSAITSAEQRLADQAQRHCDELTAHVTGAITSAEQRLAHQAQVNVEAVKSESKLSAEGYAATVDSINRRLDDLQAAVGTKFQDHDAVLKDHGDRIQTLEHRNS